MTTILLFCLWALIALLIGYIAIIEKCHAKEVKKLKKERDWQNKKYETWRGYMNKGYRIAHDKTYGEILLDRIREI